MKTETRELTLIQFGFLTEIKDLIAFYPSEEENRILGTLARPDWFYTYEYHRPYYKETFPLRINRTKLDEINKARKNFIKGLTKK